MTYSVHLIYLQDADGLIKCCVEMLELINNTQVLVIKLCYRLSKSVLFFFLHLGKKIKLSLSDKERKK